MLDLASIEIAAQPRSIATQQTLIVQQRLQSLGYDVGTPDGVIGPRTQRAIAAYQQSHREQERRDEVGGVYYVDGAAMRQALDAMLDVLRRR